MPDGLQKDAWAVCTIAAKPQLALARVVARSFRRHHPGVPVFVLLADRAAGAFDPARASDRLVPSSTEPRTTDSVAGLDVVCVVKALGAPETEEMARRYTEQEFSYALTPWLMQWVLRQGFGRVLFLKQESLVTASLEPLMDRLRAPGVSLLLTPHLLAPLGSVARELNILQCGTFNGGFVAVRGGGEGDRFLAWWQERLLEDCRYAPAEGLHFEQRWLDLAPGLLDGVEVVRDPGVNVGHWHLPERQVRVEGETIWADGSLCRLFRFSGFDMEHPEKATRYFDRLRMEKMGDAAQVFRRYREELEAAGYWEIQQGRDWLS